MACSSGRFSRNFVAVERLVGHRPIERPAGFEQPQLEQLARIVPLVDGVRNVEPLVALQPDQIGAERGRGGGRQRRLADARFTLEEQRTPELQGDEERHCQPAVADIALLGETLLEFGNGGRHRSELTRKGAV
jgi:hypothetical protein